MFTVQIADFIPTDLSDEFSGTEDSLWGASSIANLLPLDLLVQVKAAFTEGLNVANRVGAVLIFILAMLAGISLRHIGTIKHID